MCGRSSLHDAPVSVLERFSLLSVPEDEAERVVEAVSGSEVAGTQVKLQRAG